MDDEICLEVKNQNSEEPNIESVGAKRRKEGLLVEQLSKDTGKIIKKSIKSSSYDRAPSGKPVAKLLL